jgi:hypothetical protein
MYMIQGLIETPFHAIFVFFLIIAGNYLGELFPCKVQKLLVENVFLKHLFAFLTLLFFVVLVDPVHTQTFNGTFITSIILYIMFLFLINTNVLFFLISIITLAVMYVLTLKKKDYSSEENNDSIAWIDQMNYILSIFFIISSVVGCLVYMGEKKIEYKNKFDYLTFIFGKPSCRGFSPKTKLLGSLLAAFR